MNPYSRHILEIVVAQICETVGWHSIQSTPLELLIDLLHRHITMISSSLRSYSELFGRTEPNLNDLGLVFRDCKILVPDLEEYIQYVESVPYPGSVPKYPIPKDNHLNFLKPGSREVLTRPVHVHEYLPPMYPDKEDVKPKASLGDSDNDTSTSPALSEQFQDSVFKKPVEPLCFETPVKRIRLLDEECNSRPTREISSVMMTTSGFISPAREGKLPEARSPVTLTETVNIVPTNIAANVSKLDFTKDDKKTKKLKQDRDKKKSKEELKASKPVMTSPTNSNENKRKKVVSMKEVLKNKALKTGVVKTDNNSTTWPSSESSPICVTDVDAKSPVAKPLDFSIRNSQKCSQVPLPTPVPDDPVPVPQPVVDDVITIADDECDLPVIKLPTGTTITSDKHKLNVFKKKMKAKEEKIDNMALEIKPPDVLPDVEIVKHSSQLLESNISSNQKNKDILNNEKPSSKSIVREFKSDNIYDDDLSTPKTLDALRQSPPPKPEKDKKKKKDKIKTKKLKLFKSKSLKHFNKMKAEEFISMSQMNAQFCPPPFNAFMNMPYSPFANSPSLIPNPSLFPGLMPSPALIPNNPVNKVFPHLPMSMPLHPRFPGFGQAPHIASHSIPMFANRKSELDKPPDSVVPQPISVCNVPPLVLSSTTDELHVKPSSTDKTPTKDTEEHEEYEKKKEKDHKKDKKDKEEKSKKKKEKKDKMKNKDRDKKKEKEDRREKSDKKKEKKDKKREERENEGSIPKLTLKLGPKDCSSPRPQTPDSTGSRKITIKPVLPKDEVVKAAPLREPSPELAKISALFTRPSKPKIPKTNPVEDVESACNQVVSTTSNIPVNSGRSRKNNVVRVPGQARVEDIVAKLPLCTSVTLTPSNPPELESLPKPPPAKKTVDQFGNEVWICPACSRQDDGSPMIGCDDCDAWYHWVCVGIQIPPDTNEDWYCSHCIQRKKQLSQIDSDKKRKRKKNKKAH